jgi:serine/threonine-protein kinase
MGEVYRATDIKLHRDVAIKVLPSDVAADPDRLSRFEREAQVLASLNHPNIAHIHGVDDSTGVPALIMELVEGPTLADRIARGPIPLDEALPIAKQIAEALEAAHEQGIIHRDLKPANIKLRPDGAVKVLDFGLAKAFDPVAATAGLATMSPTLSMHATQAGLILGTAAYMSPEQAAGKKVDTRTDLWAFGVVLFEMLTGRQLFDGESVSHVLAAVLKDHPDWTVLPASTPASIARLLRRCLQKDRVRRLDSAAAARLDIEEALETPVVASAPAVARSRRTGTLAVGAAVVGALIAGAATWTLTHSEPPPAAQPMRFAIVPPTGQTIRFGSTDRDLALSPDGTHLAYVSADRTAVSGNLFVRAIDRLEAESLSESARYPFWSPDGRWIAYFTSGEIRRIPVNGGPPITICGFTGAPRGGSWGPDDTIVFATTDPSTGILRVRAGGGDPVVLTKPDLTKGEQDHFFPSVVAGGSGVLFTVLNAAGGPGTVTDGRHTAIWFSSR